MSNAVLDTMFGLSGRTALVTGARSGIGKAIAAGLADVGARVVLWGRDEDIRTSVDEITSRGGSAFAAVADLADSAAIDSTAAEVLRTERVDILVNNAGVIDRGPAAETDAESWRRLFAVNLDAARQLCVLFGQPMLERGYGKIVNIASMLSFQGGRRVSGYTTSKHAILGLTRALATEWAPYGVRVNALAPGYVATANTAPLRADPERAEEIRSRIPLGRWAEPTDMVGAAIFLASQASDYVTGHTLAVDGGWLAT